MRSPGVLPAAAKLKLAKGRSVERISGKAFFMGAYLDVLLEVAEERRAIEPPDSPFRSFRRRWEFGLSAHMKDLVPAWAGTSRRNYSSGLGPITAVTRIRIGSTSTI